MSHQPHGEVRRTLRHAKSTRAVPQIAGGGKTPRKFFASSLCLEKAIVQGIKGVSRTNTHGRTGRFWLFDGEEMGNNAAPELGSLLGDADPFGSITIRASIFRQCSTIMFVHRLSANFLALFVNPGKQT